MSRSKQLKEKKTYNELYAEYAPKSLCATTVIGGTVNPSLIHIRLAGPIANVPALKNQKIKNKNILRPEAKVIFDLMTRAFQRSVNFQIPQFEPSIEVFMLVLCAYRKNSFDEDNVMTSIRDWLEPKHIRGSDRGWGIDVVKNDKMVNAYAVKKSKSATDSHITDIYLRRLKDVRKARDRFLSELVGQDINKMY